MERRWLWSPVMVVRIFKGERRQLPGPFNGLGPFYLELMPPGRREAI